MKKLALFSLIFVLGLVGASIAATESVLLDDYEIAVSGGPEGTVDFGAGNGSSVDVTSAQDIKQSNAMSLKVAFDAVQGGYIYVARGSNLTAKNAAWDLKPESIDWKKYDAISFYMFGTDSKTKIAFDVKDSGNELWRFIVEDNFKGWKQLVCPFAEFFPRNDWQPDDSDKSGVMDFPIKSYQYEPLPVAKGTLYFDKVELLKR